MNSTPTLESRAARALYMRRWVAGSPERAEDNRARARRWNAENGQTARERKRAHYRKNAARLKAKRNAYYAANKEKSLACSSRWRANNALKVTEYFKDYYRKTKDKYRDMTLRRRFGITLGEYGDKLERQGGACAICGRRAGKRALAVDHDHATGNVRGILCHYCNTALGKANDDPALLRKMAEYLEKHGKTGAAS